MKHLLTAMILGLLIVASAHAASYEREIPTNSDYKISGPRLTMSALKYDPYPVNPGEWFDVWVSVQNTGEQSAQDVSFAIESTYPFIEADNTGVLSYPSIAGTSNAFLEKLPGENVTQANQVLLKFHVKVAQSAKEGTYNLPLRARYRGTTDTYTNTSYDVPITIEKTKTDFAIAMQDSSAQRTTFAITNIGEKMGNAVTVTVLDKDVVRNTDTAIIGNLNTGDFTTISFDLDSAAAVSQVQMEVSYTDTAGNRASVTKTVPVHLSTSGAAAPTPAAQDTTLGMSTKWVYAFVALIVGIIVALVLGRVARRE